MKQIFKLLLACIAVQLLSSCPAGLAPIVGYPTGSKANDPEVISVIPASNGHAQMSLYCQKIDHNYTLVLTPEGGRDHYPLKESYRYFVKMGDGEMKELKFLRSNPGVGPRPAEYLSEIYPLPTGDGWVAYGLCSGEPQDTSSFLETPEEKAAAENMTSRYFITVFTPAELKARVEVQAKSRKPGFAYRKSINAVRYHGPSGWMIYRVADNQIVKEP